MSDHIPEAALEVVADDALAKRIRQVLADFEIYNLSRGLQWKTARNLSAAGADPDDIRHWLETLVVEFRDAPLRVPRVAASVLDDVAAAMDVFDGHKRAREVRLKILADAGYGGSKAHDVNRDPDAEERRRQRHCAESVILLDEPVGEAAKRYGYPVDLVERLAEEWRGKFRRDPDGGES